jgi:glutamate 5-kinase
MMAHGDSWRAHACIATFVATGLGATDLGFEERPRSLGLRQACAAVGQGHLIGFYAQAFAQLGIKVAQVPRDTDRSAPTPASSSSLSSAAIL